jgi:arsenate reductase
VLGEHGIAFEAREYFKHAFTREEIESVLARSGLSAADLVSTHSIPYRKGNLGELGLTDADWIERMIAEPRLVRRPILVTDDEVVVGFDRTRYERIAQRLGDETRPYSEKEKE